MCHMLLDLSKDPFEYYGFLWMSLGHWTFIVYNISFGRIIIQAANSKKCNIKDTISYIPCLRMALAEIAWDCIRSGRGWLQQCHFQTRHINYRQHLFLLTTTLSEKIAHSTGYHHLSHLSVDIQLGGLIKFMEDSGALMTTFGMYIHGQSTRNLYMALQLL